MHFDALANELILHIFQSCNSVADTLNLAATCHRFHSVLTPSRKLPILFQAAETQYGPLRDATQIVTYNSSQAVHMQRRVPISLALLKQLLQVGRIAQKWEEIYPLKKWKSNFCARRLLSSDERYLVRRAIYRLWLYSRAFHNVRYPRITRNMRHNVLERAELLHNWTSQELAEIEDVRFVIREVVNSQICPSNGTIQRKFRKRFPESETQLLFNIHLNYPPPPNMFQSHFHSAHQVSANPKVFPAAAAGLKYVNTKGHEVGTEGWGDDIPHYYVVEDMLKLDPGQIMWLKENAPLKDMVDTYVKTVGGEWFDNNGETFGQTLEWVMEQRGEDVEELRATLEDGEGGIAVR